MKNQLYILLDHQQSLLQNYRSLTVMFQTFLIAVAGVLLTLLQNSDNINNGIFFIIYIFICIIGFFATYALFRTCNIRAFYVDAIQNLIYALEKGKITIEDNFPILSSLKFAQDIDEIEEKNLKIYLIILKSKLDAIKIKRSTTRFVFVYVFHGTFLAIWVFFALMSATTFKNVIIFSSI